MMEKRILFCATVDYHFKAFHLPYLKWFKEQGWEVHVAAKGEIELPYVDKKYNLSIERSPFHKRNIKAYRELKTILNQNQYAIVHCHTPMGGVIARLAGRHARHNGTKVMYTAHGFHFCKGAPIQNWLIYFPIEKFLAKYTDCLITINGEDYKLAKQHFSAKSIEHVHGVGIDTDYFKPIDMVQKMEQRQSWGYKPDDFLLFYAAEFNKNKNQQLLIKALASVKEEIPNAKILLAGKGPLIENCKELAHKLGVHKMVHFLGYREYINSILPMCDVAIASSLREGLPVNIMEAMACGLPVIATDNRGHRELVHNFKNGWIVNKDDHVEFGNKLKVLYKTNQLKDAFGDSGRKIIRNHYSISKVMNEKQKIYFEFMKETEGQTQWAVQ